MSKLIKNPYLASIAKKHRLTICLIIALAIFWAMPVSASTDNQNPLSKATEIKPFKNLYDILYNKITSSAKNFSLISPGDLILSFGQKKTGTEDKETNQDKNQFTIKDKRKIIVTAYSSTPDQTDSSPFITAKGTFVREGVVATNFLKFGTKIRLPEVYGDKVFVVEDRMAQKNNHKLDIWMESRNEALWFGVQRLTLEILN